MSIKSVAIFFWSGAKSYEQLRTTEQVQKRVLNQDPVSEIALSRERGFDTTVTIKLVLIFLWLGAKSYEQLFKKHTNTKRRVWRQESVSEII